MKIAFILIGNGRRSNYLNGDTLRYGGGGGSGTDTSTILVAEYLAKIGHNVVIATDKLEPQLEAEYAKQNKFFPKGDIIRGVQYTDIEFNHIENKEFDILVSSLWFHDYKRLPITVTKALVYWCHMQWVYGISEMLEYVKKNNLKLGFINISKWERKMNASIVQIAYESHDKVFQELIPNPVADDVIRDVLEENISKKPFKFIFHASWPRGGNVAVDAVRKIHDPRKEFHAFDYLMVIHNHSDTFFHMHNGVDKYTLFKHLAESDYFIYPLYTPYQDVHKDTFSCVVAEALALGVTVLSYPLGALPDLYQDYVHWLEFPEGVDPEKMQQEQLTKDLEGKFQTTDNILKTIEFLELNPAIKEHNKEKSRQYILDNFNINIVGAMWDKFFTRVVNTNYD